MLAEVSSHAAWLLYEDGDEDADLAPGAKAKTGWKLAHPAGCLSLPSSVSAIARVLQGKAQVYISTDICIIM